jgi:hypothetical protein
LLHVQYHSMDDLLDLTIHLISIKRDRDKFMGEGKSRQEDVETSFCPGWAQPKQTPSPFFSQPRRQVVSQVRSCSEVTYSQQTRTGERRRSESRRGGGWSDCDVRKTRSEKAMNAGFNMAEGARFELADRLPHLRFSRPARSATPSPLHTGPKDFKF